MCIEEMTSADFFLDGRAHFSVHEELLRDTAKAKAYRDAILGNSKVFVCVIVVSLHIVDVVVVLQVVVLGLQAIVVVGLQAVVVFLIVVVVVVVCLHAVVVVVCLRAVVVVVVV